MVLPLIVEKTDFLNDFSNIELRSKEMNVTQILLSISVCVFMGLMFSRICKLLKLPAVTGYLITGVIIGCFCLGRIVLPGGYYLGFHDMSFGDVSYLGIVSDIALGFIAFSIGSEFKLQNLKQTGKQALVITLVQAYAASAVTCLVLLGMHFILLAVSGKDILPTPAVLILGAIATATAPAATLMVVRQYKAKGPLTDMLLPIVALDDAVCLINFAVLFGVSKAMLSGSISLMSVLVEPLIEIFASLLVGALLGLLLSFIEKMFHSNSNRLSLVIAFVFLTVAITTLEDLTLFGAHVGFSSLLTCMMCGTVFCNVCECSDEMMKRADSWTKPLLILFFVISGAQLDLKIFTKPIFILIGVVYILARSAGKYFGARFSSQMVKCDKSIVNYLGITLLPQAGVALGMVSAVANDPIVGAHDIASTVRFVILFGVMVYEIFGPVLTKWALTKAGDIHEKPEGLTRRIKNEKNT